MKAEIEKLQQYVWEWDSTIKALNIDLSSRDDTIEKNKQQIELLKAEIEDLNKKIDEMQIEIEGLKQNS